MAGTAILSIKS